MRRPRSNSTVARELDELRDRNAEEALKIVHDLMPRKILKLARRFESARATKRSRERLPSNAGDLQAVIAADERSEVAVNPGIAAILIEVKQEILDLVNFMGVLQLWVRLNVPKIEDGDNFGVSVQDEILQMLATGRASGQVVLQSITAYYFRRGKLVTLAQKHPLVADYPRGIMELDEKQFTDLLESWMDLRNNYSLLRDKIVKNLPKLEKPRKPNTDMENNGMYF